MTWLILSLVVLLAVVLLWLVLKRKKPAHLSRRPVGRTNRPTPDLAGRLAERGARIQNSMEQRKPPPPSR